MREYELIRSRRKTIAMQARDGRLIVRAPMRASKKDIEATLAKFEPQICRMLEKNIALTEQRAGFSLDYGKRALYRGGEYPIVARSGDRAGFDDERGEFYLPPNLSPERVKYGVVQIYKMLARRHLAER
ncbi:MAG: DUF45 domain-containing protein, partial [Oscillospiraceae bacterium]|nr:DUF45 domain-containing protein [Oscillospiraceae bacterium]